MTTYNVNQTILRNILQRKTFKHLDIGDISATLLNKTSKDIMYKKYDTYVVKIFDMFAMGDNMRFIGRTLNIERKIISGILHRNYYKYIVINKNIEEKVKLMLPKNIK